MKRIILFRKSHSAVSWFRISIVIPILLLSHISLHAANRFWIASANSNWNNTANWSTTSGGVGGATVPGAGDVANFNNLGLGNCSFDIDVTVNSIVVNANYTSVITQGAYKLTTNAAATFAGGTFSGGTADILIAGVLTISGTVFTSTSGILELRSNAAFTGGSFIHNNGSVRWNGVSVGGPGMTGNSPAFYNFEMVGLAKTYTISSTGNVPVSHQLLISGTQAFTLNTGVLDISGDIVVTNTSTGGGGNARINMVGTGAQNFTGSTGAGFGALPQFTINNIGGSVNFSGYPSFANTFTYSAGTINAGSSTFCFVRGTVGAFTITGSMVLNDIYFSAPAAALTITIAAGTALDVNDMQIDGTANLILNTGTIHVLGNLLLTNTATAGGGSATLTFQGTGNQTIDGTAITGNQSRLPIVVINKTSGTLNLTGNISHAANITYQAGIVSAIGSTSYFVTTLTVAGSFSLYNLVLNSTANQTITITAGSTLTVSNTLSMQNGAFNLNINTGTLAVQGDLLNTNTGIAGGGSGTVLFNGSGNQTITTTGVIDQGRFPAVTINKPSGTLIFPTLMTVRGNWTYTAGAIDALTNASDIVFENTLVISGSHTLNHVTFYAPANYTYTIAAATTLTLAGDLDISGTSNATFNTGDILLNGNLNLTNTGAAGGGTATIHFVSPSNQAIVSALSVNQSSLPGIDINKATGTLLFPALITSRGNWTYTTGTLDITTNNSTVVFANTQTITGTHTLRNVWFEGNANHTHTFPTGTILTITNTLSITGASNIVWNSTVAGNTAIQAQGDISISNTAAGGGGTAGILINGTGTQTLSSTAAISQGRLPYITIQKTSGTLTLSGIISASRNWTYLSGTIDASTNSSTVAFGGNNLSITSAGMNFYHVNVTANTSTLLTSLSVNGNLTISNTGVLAPGVNTINLLGNWIDRGTAGFTEAASTVNFSGTSLQTITSAGGENFTNLTVNNSGPGIQLINNATVATTLNMTQGNIDLNGNVLTLGLSVANRGTLSRTAGTMINTGTFTRWFNTLVIPNGSVTGLFPTGTSTDYRPINVSAPASGPTTGGTISVSYTDATSNTVVSIPDGAFTVVLRKDLNWNLATANGFAGGNYNLMIQGTGYGAIGNVNDLRITLANAVTGTAGVNGGTTTNPQINRTGITQANLNNTFYIGSIDAASSPLPVTWLSFTARQQDQKVRLEWKTSAEFNNDHFTVQRSTANSGWTNITTVQGSGNTSVVTTYSAYDELPVKGTSFYRIQQTDLDGKTSYSSICQVEFENTIGLRIFPNPATDYLIIENSGSGIKQFSMFNSDGQSVSVSAEAKSGGQTKLLFSNLSSGVYYLRIVADGHSETYKILVRR